MTISSSLNAGVAGLAANANRLASISDNISNSSTFGYKRVETDFHSLVTASGNVRYTAGGVRTSTQRMIDKEGSLVTTTNATDLAVRGGGFLPVTRMTEVRAGVENPEMLLTTTGSFRVDSQGYLTTQTGEVLLAWPAAADGTIPAYPRGTTEALEPVRINLSQLSGEPTTAVSLGMNLPASATLSSGTGDPINLPVQYFDNLGVPRMLDFTFTPTVAAPGDPATNTWDVVIEDSANPGTPIGEYEIEFDSNPVTGGSILSVTAGATGLPFDPLTGKMIVNVAGGPIEIEVGIPGESNAMTQLSDRFAPLSIVQNGTAVGNMTSVEVDPNGFVRAFFDSGATRTIYRVPLADVANPNGMTAFDNQLYAPTPRSGSFYLWDAAAGPTGDIAAFSREESTTDVAAELTSMIQTQRAYSSNAKVIQTVDEMLQETTNIKR